MNEGSRRRRLVARLAAGGRDGDDTGDDGGDDEVRLLPEETAPRNARPVARRARPTAPPVEPPARFPALDAVAPALPRKAPARGSAAAYRADAMNPGPLPEPLPPPLDAVVRGLREDLLAAGGDAAGLADEICSRHRDRLRAVLAGLASGLPVSDTEDDGGEDVRLTAPPGPPATPAGPPV